MTQGSIKPNYYVDNSKRSSFPIWGKIISILFGILIISFISFSFYNSQNNTKDNSSNEITTMQKEPRKKSELGTSGVASQGSAIKDMAEDKNIDLSHINHDIKMINVDNDKIVSSITPLSLYINNPLKIINSTTECVLEGENSFCYVGEIESENKKIATILAFSDIFNTKFFSLLTEVEHINVGTSPMSFVSKLDNSEGNDGIFITDLNGTGFVIIMENSEKVDNIIADINYQ